MAFNLDTRFQAQGAQNDALCGNRKRVNHGLQFRLSHLFRRSSQAFCFRDEHGRWKDCSREHQPGAGPPPAPRQRTNTAGIWPSSPARCKSSRKQGKEFHGARTIMSVSGAEMVRKKGGRVSRHGNFSIEPFLT